MVPTTLLNLVLTPTSPAPIVPKVLNSIDKVKIIKNLFIGLVLLIILFSTFGTIGAGEVGVRTTIS
jgi:ABC-type long-subunit fatty acid transport system fused permease/ATPase subunit